MSLTIAQLVDETTILPGSPLRFGLTGYRITGARVVLEWIVHSWFQATGANRLSPNSTVDIRDLENATHDERTAESWRAALVRCAKAVTIGFLASIDVAVTFSARTWRIAAAAVLVDGSRHELAVTVGEIGTTIKFGGAA